VHDKSGASLPNLEHEKQYDLQRAAAVKSALYHPFVGSSATDDFTGLASGLEVGRCVMIDGLHATDQSSKRFVGVSFRIAR
jgi:hypothetical protein